MKLYHFYFYYNSQKYAAKNVHHVNLLVISALNAKETIDLLQHPTVSVYKDIMMLKIQI